MTAEPGIQPEGPRAVLRVPEVMRAVALRKAATLAELVHDLKLPKTSLFRLLRTLERGAYLTVREGNYSLGPAAFDLARAIAASAPRLAFPASARPVLEALAAKTGETAMLGRLADGGDEVVYVDVIDSSAPVRFTVGIGDRRPLYSAASGKAVLAFLPKARRQAYLDRCEFVPFTPLTVRREALPAQLSEAAERAIAIDDGGKVMGAAGIASPVFGADGRVFAAVSAAGPAERMLAERSKIERAVFDAGEQISRLVGYLGDYPPAQPS
jgi:IclR family transcriptional regulator, KDG regulon repressor